MKPLLPLPLLSLPLALAANGFQPVDSIRDAALRTVPDLGAPGVQAEAAVDAALRLPACPQPLEAKSGGNGIVEVGCAAAGWRLYVQVRVQRSRPVLVLTRPVAAGEPLREDMYAVELRDVTRLGTGVLTDPGQLAGRVARRALGAGSPLTAQDLVSPRSVRRGDAVTLVSRHGAVEVRAAGRALGEAGADERLSVENLASRRIVQGIVRENGEVEVLR